VLPHERLLTILGRERLLVNGFHHQAIAELGRVRRLAARRPEDGVVEGTEAMQARGVLSVQWHTEPIWNQPDPFQSSRETHSEACPS
jgi:gamma-glutamyl-gamma-aminobutyrate hydrolase PuuD